MTVAGLLAGLGPGDPEPTLGDLGGARAVQDELADLPVHLVPEVVAAMAADLDAVDDLEELFVDVSTRVKADVLGPLSFARCADSLLRIAVARSTVTLTRALMDVFLSVAEKSEEEYPGALRRGYAIRAAVDLALLDVGVSIHAPLATIEKIDTVPAEMAPSLTRAVGRLSEHSESQFLVRLLENELSGHENAAADALVELGLISMRAAFKAPDVSGAEGGLRRAVVLLERAARYDGDRPDARAFLGGARAVLAFSENPGALPQGLKDLLVAQRELTMYGGLNDDEFHGATPLRSSAAWLVLASELETIRDHLDHPDRLDLRPGLEALLKAYGGARLAVLSDEQRGFTKFIQPVIVRQIAGQPGLPEAVEQLAGRTDAPTLASDLARAVMRPKVGGQRIPRRRMGIRGSNRPRFVRLRPRRPLCS
jgi:hypothetical protein